MTDDERKAIGDIAALLVLVDRPGFVRETPWLLSVFVTYRARVRADAEYDDHARAGGKRGASTAELEALQSALEKAADLLRRPAIALGAEHAHRSRASNERIFDSSPPEVRAELVESFGMSEDVDLGGYSGATIQSDMRALARLSAVVVDMRDSESGGLPDLRSGALTDCVDSLMGIWTKATGLRPSLKDRDRKNLLTPFTRFALAALNLLDDSEGKRDNDRRLRQIIDAAKYLRSKSKKSEA